MWWRGLLGACIFPHLGIMNPRTLQFPILFGLPMINFFQILITVTGYSIDAVLKPEIAYVVVWIWPITKS